MSVQMSHFGQAESQANLLAEFTEAQMENFKQAFKVFDIDKDGKISINEIFEVLSTMGNQISEERRLKIESAVAKVDRSGRGLLELPQFIQFMEIMKQHNAVEEQEREHEPAFEPVESAPVISSKCYGGCAQISLEHAELLDRKASCCFVSVSVLIWLLFALQWIHVAVMSAGAFSDYVLGESSEYDDVFPQEKVQDPNNASAEITNPDFYDKFPMYIRDVRLLNIINIVCFLYNAALKDISTLEDFGYEKTNGNWFRLYSRPIFVFNALASLVYVYGMRPSLAESSNISDMDYIGLMFLVQIIITFIMMSKYLYLDALKIPTSCSDQLIIALIDVFALNWIRLILSLIINVVQIILLPFSLLTALLMLVMLPCKTGCTSCYATLYRVLYLPRMFTLETFAKAVMCCKSD